MNTHRHSEWSACGQILQEMAKANFYYFNNTKVRRLHHHVLSSASQPLWVFSWLHFSASVLATLISARLIVDYIVLFLFTGVLYQTTCLLLSALLSRYLSVIVYISVTCDSTTTTILVQREGRCCHRCLCGVWSVLPSLHRDSGLLLLQWDWVLLLLFRNSKLLIQCTRE